MPPRGPLHPPFETGFANLDFAGRGGDDLAVVDQKGLGRIGPDRNLAGDRYARPVKHAVRDFHAVVLESGAVPTCEAVRALVAPARPVLIPALTPAVLDLGVYDPLLAARYAHG